MLQGQFTSLESCYSELSQLSGRQHSNAVDFVYWHPRTDIRPLNVVPRLRSQLVRKDELFIRLVSGSAFDKTVGFASVTPRDHRLTDSPISEH